MKALALTKTPAHSERRLRVSFRQNGSSVPTGKPQLEPGVPADRRDRPAIATRDERFG